MKLFYFLGFLSLIFQSSWAIFDANDESKQLLEYEKNTISVFEQNARSVVNISTVVRARVGSFFSYDVMEIPKGTGTGFVWDQDGHIITNFHVIADSGSVYVTFKDDLKQYQAKLVGVEPRKDIAVLKLVEKPKAGLIAIKKGTSKTLQVGQKAMAIGNPFGLDHTITSGIISALGRKVDGVARVEIHGMIQADASINPGNSGGPLLNSAGEVIGMNTMIYSNSGSSAGVGFAVPIDSIKRIVPDIIKYGKFQQPGIGIEALDSRMASYMEIPEGVVIRSVIENGPADKAGLKGISAKKDRYQIGDIITELDGKKVNSLSDIYNILVDYKVGDKVEVHYQRKGKKEKTNLVLMNLANDSD